LSQQAITLSLLTDLQKKEWTQSIWDAITESKKAIREAEAANTDDDIDLEIEEDIKINIKNKVIIKGNQ